MWRLLELIPFVAFISISHSPKKFWATQSWPAINVSQSENNNNIYWKYLRCCSRLIHKMQKKKERSEENKPHMHKNGERAFIHDVKKEQKPNSVAAHWYHSTRILLLLAIENSCLFSVCMWVCEWKYIDMLFVYIQYRGTGNSYSLSSPFKMFDI